MKQTEGLTMSPHGSLVGSLLLTMVICLPLTDTWLSSMTLQPEAPLTDGLDDWQIPHCNIPFQKALPDLPCLSNGIHTSAETAPHMTSF